MLVAQILYALPDASVRRAAAALGVPGHEASPVLLLIQAMAARPDITLEELRAACAPGEVDGVLRSREAR